MSKSIERLLRPRSLAIVGASPEKGSMGSNVLVNITRAGFRGPLHLVSRNRSEIDGKACLKSIDDVPEGVDAVLLVVPAAAVCDAVQACIRRKAGGVVVFAAGYGEAGDEGRRQQDEVAQIARAGGLAMLGPNCIGLVNYVDGLPLTFEPVEPAMFAGPGICAIAQSGGMAGNIRQALQAKGVPVAYAISTGNEAALSAIEIAGVLVESADVAAFALFVEQIGDPHRFIAVARRALALSKPIVLLHSGRSARAAEAAKSHTGALAGDWAVMRAFVEREGVVVVATPDELFDTTAILARYPSPPPLPAAVTTNSGAIRGFTLDLADDIGLELAALSAATNARLREVVPDFATIDNPLDLTAQTMTKPSMFGDSAAAMLADSGVGAVVVAAMGGGPKQQLDKWRAVAPVLSAAYKPNALVLMGDGSPLVPEMLAEITAARVPFFRSPERALRALKHVATYARLRVEANERAALIPAATVDLAGTGTIAEHRGKAVLATAGIPVPKGLLASSVAEAETVAKQIGYPVVLKAQADALAHKSDAGGVAVGIADAGELRAAWGKMQGTVARAAPGVVLDGILVEAMAPKGGLEMIVGAQRDPVWGPVLLAGLGGIWTEAMSDVRLIPAGASLAQIERELMQLKAAKLLTGYRGQPARNVNAVARTLSLLGALMLASPRLSEIEINPLMVYADGQGVLALDALLVMAPAA